jgi:poly(A) polymerase
MSEPNHPQPVSRRDEPIDRPVELSPRAILRAREIEGSGRIPSALEPDGPPAEIPLDRLDPDALKVIYRLRAFGHQAYLVGGCVRDLSLGMKPKDFDVATSAHPGEVRAVFRNCRLIGRRFRLAHVYFKGGKVIETATFRANPNEDLEQIDPGDDLLIARDNVFGTAEEDARRRDFTVNGLFYDVVLGRVIDYVGGREDLALRRIRTIGDPDVRFREDPVRILRAVRFAAKCGFTIEERTFAAMKRYAGEIARCAPPRVLEEIFRLLRSGASRRCFELLQEAGALPVLLPPLAEFLDRAAPEEARALFVGLGLLDEVVARGPLPDDAVLLSALLVHLSRRELIKEAKERGAPRAGGAGRQAAPGGPGAIPVVPEAAAAPEAAASGGEGAPASGEAAGAETAAATLVMTGGSAGEGAPAAGASAPGGEEGAGATAAPEATAEGGPAEAASSGTGTEAPAEAEEEEEEENGEAHLDLEAEAEAEAVAPLPAEPTEEEAPKVPWSASAAATSVEALLAELVRTARLPRKIAERARLLLYAQRILSGVKRRRGSPAQFVRQHYFGDALVVFDLYVRSTGQGTDQLERWKTRVAQVTGRGQPPATPPETAEAPAAPAPAAAAPAEGEAAAAAGETAAAEGPEGRKRRRRGGRRRRGRGAGEAAAAPEAEVEAEAGEPAAATEAPAVAVAAPVAPAVEPAPAAPRPDRRDRQRAEPYPLPQGPAELFPF